MEFWSSLRQKSTAAGYTVKFVPNSRMAVVIFWMAFKTCNALQHCKYRKNSSATGCYSITIFRATSHHCKSALQMQLDCVTLFNIYKRRPHSNNLLKTRVQWYSIHDYSFLTIKFFIVLPLGDDLSLSSSPLLQRCKLPLVMTKCLIFISSDTTLFCSSSTSLREINWILNKRRPRIFAAPESRKIWEAPRRLSESIPQPCSLDYWLLTRERDPALLPKTGPEGAAEIEANRLFSYTGLGPPGAWSGRLRY